jgi:hypothetical protein
LEFTLQTMQGQISQNYVPYNHTEEERTCRERAVEYAVETIRSLTATEESDAPLMQTPGLLVGLAMMARGGPIGVPSATNSPRSSATSPRRVSDLASALRPISQSSSSSGGGSPVSIMSQHVARSDSPPLTKPITSDWPVMNSKTRLHACIAIMNLSCGKSNKIQIAQLPLVLQSMRHVMMDAATTSEWQALTTSANAAQHLQESRLKATTCIKNLSNADANDANLLHTPGLVEALVMSFLFRWNNCMLWKRMMLPPSGRL